MNSVLIKSAVLSSAFALLAVPAAQATSAVNLAAVTNGLAYLSTKQAADGHIGASAGDTGWSAIAYAAAGSDLGSVLAPGGASLRAYLAANPPSAAASATDWERTILAITADHQNPYNFGGINYVAKLAAFASAHQLGSPTASNDDFFGLMALMAARVSTADPVVTDEVAYILSHQHADGGFSYTTDPAVTSDVDDTAAAIMALQAAKNAGLGSGALTTALSDARAYMLATQNSDGGFPYDPLTPPAWGGPVSNVSTTAWVVMALGALGQGGSGASTDAQAYIRLSQAADGSFPYTAPGAGDVFDTAPAVTALAGGQYPLHIYAGSLPSTDRIASPSPTATPTLSPAPGSVLGASTDPGSGAAGSVLPAVGELSNAVLLAIAFAIAFAAGTIAFFRQRRRS